MKKVRQTLQGLFESDYDIYVIDDIQKSAVDLSGKKVYIAGNLNVVSLHEYIHTLYTPHYKDMLISYLQGLVNKYENIPDEMRSVLIKSIYDCIQNVYINAYIINYYGDIMKKQESINALEYQLNKVKKLAQRKSDDMLEHQFNILDTIIDALQFCMLYKQEQFKSIITKCYKRLSDHYRVMVDLPSIYKFLSNMDKLTLKYFTIPQCIQNLYESYLDIINKMYTKQKVEQMLKQMDIDKTPDNLVEIDNIDSLENILQAIQETKMLLIDCRKYLLDKQYKRSDKGILIRYPQYLAQGCSIFVNPVRSYQDTCIVVDCSGSMRLKRSHIENLFAQYKHVNIALYSGTCSFSDLINVLPYFYDCVTGMIVDYKGNVFRKVNLKDVTVNMLSDDLITGFCILVNESSRQHVNTYLDRVLANGCLTMNCVDVNVIEYTHKTFNHVIYCTDTQFTTEFGFTILPLPLKNHYLTKYKNINFVYQKSNINVSDVRKVINRLS